MCVCVCVCILVMIVIFLDDKVSVMQQIAKALSRTKELYLPPKEPYDLPKEPYDHSRWPEPCGACVTQGVLLHGR